MAAYEQSRSICNKLFEAGEAGLSVKDLFVAEAASASDQDGIFSLDIILTESLVLAVADGRVVEGVFIAEEVLAKHDEKYMPAEIEDRIKAAAENVGS